VGKFIRQLQLTDGEHVVWSRLATKYQGTRGVAGRLTLTTRRLAFEPTIIERMLKGRRWSVQLNSIAETFLVPPTVALLSNVHGGSWMPVPARIGLRMRDGTEETVIVKRLEEAVSAIEEQLLHHGGEPDPNTRESSI
jgi:hypothetical protein